MNTNFLTIASVFALLALTPSLAKAENETTTGTQQQTESSLERGIRNTGDAISQAARDAVDATKMTYEEIKYTYFDDGVDVKGVPITIDERMTAEGMLGEPVNNTAGERVGTLKDIILDANGQAILAVVSDADFVDIASKEIAVDYGMIMRRDEDGDIVMPLTEEAIESAKEFSYNEDDKGDEDTRVIPDGGYSVEALLGAEVMDPNRETVADVDNIVFRSGVADTLIVGFRKVLGMGGEDAAMKFSKVQIIRDEDGEADFQLTAQQAAQLESFRQTASN